MCHVKTLFITVLRAFLLMIIKFFQLSHHITCKSSIIKADQPNRIELLDRNIDIVQFFSQFCIYVATPASCTMVPVSLRIS